MLVFGGVVQSVVLNFLDILRLLYFYTTESLKKFLAYPFLPLHPKNTCFLLIRFFPKSRLFFHNKSCGFCSKLEKTVKAMWKNTTRESSFGCSSYVESKGGKLSGKTEASSRWDAATGMTGWIRMEGMDDWLVVLNLCYFHPYLVKIPNLTHIFPMGWNH